MTSPLTLDNRLLLACASAEPDAQDIQKLVESEPDWPSLLRKTERWSLAPLVYTNLRKAAQSGQVPQSVAERLRHLYRLDTIHGVARPELLRVTLQRFAEGEHSGHRAEGGGAGNSRLSLTGPTPHGGHRSAGAPRRPEAGR